MLMCFPIHNKYILELKRLVISMHSLCPIQVPVSIRGKLALKTKFTK